MALYAYKKRKPKIISPRGKRLILLPSILLLTGLAILGYVASPYLSFYISQSFHIDNLSKELLSPQDSFTAHAESATVSGATQSDYDKNVADNIATVNQFIQTEATNYKDLEKETGTMYLTIEKIHLIKVPIHINTDSGSEAGYGNVLKSSLAHFKGTSLPGHLGKTFIYGHSARVFSNAYASFESIFTDLDKLDLGDEFTIEYKDTTYKYSVNKVKVIDKEDLSVLQGDDSKKTVSLMTCTPPGLANMRLIVEAIEED